MSAAPLTLEEACLAIVDCEHKTAPIDPNGEYFAVGTPAMHDNRIDYGGARRISQATFLKWTTRLTPRVGDLLFAREAPVGPIVLVPESLNIAPGQRTVLLRPDQDRVDAHYLYYLLGSPREQERLREKAEGSTVRHLNVADVRRFQLPPLPGLATQRKIAATLGALDDKIESNRRSQRLLDALIRTIYADWRDHSAAERELTFGAFADVFGGATPKTAVPEYWDGDIAWTTPTDVTRLDVPYLFSTARAITDAGLASCATVLHPKGTVFMTSRATIGSFAINQVPAATNQGFIAVRPKRPIDRWFIFEEMRSRVPEFLDHANGSTFQEISRGTFKSLPLIVPSDDALLELAECLAPLHAKASQLAAESMKLTALRDAMLPELLSGRIRVPEAAETAADATV